MISRLNPTRFLLLVLILLLALAACGPAQDADEEVATLTAVSEEPAEVEEPQEEEDAPEEEVAEEEAVEPVDPASVTSTLEFDVYGGSDPGDFVTTESGLEYRIITEGDGVQPLDGQMLMVNIVGWLEDGTEITNSQAMGGPLPLPVGTSTGLVGLDEALQLLSTGTFARFVIPAELAVNEDGQSPLPPGAVIFEMQVAEIIDGPPEAPQSVNDEAYTVTDSGLKYYDVVEGDGPEVEAGQQVSVHYTGWLEDGTVFDSSVGRSPFVVTVGAGQVIPGWDEGLQGIRVGGTRQLVIPPDLGYGPGGSGPIPPNATLIFEVEVVDVQ